MAMDQVAHPPFGDKPMWNMWVCHGSSETLTLQNPIRKSYVYMYICIYEGLATAQLKEKLGNLICMRHYETFLKFVKTSPTLHSVNDPT